MTMRGNPYDHLETAKQVEGYHRFRAEKIRPGAEYWSRVAGYLRILAILSLFPAVGSSSDLALKHITLDNISQFAPELLILIVPVFIFIAHSKSKEKAEYLNNELSFFENQARNADQYSRDLKKLVIPKKRKRGPKLND